MPLAALQERASRVRSTAHGNRITFSPKVFIPLTMLCRDRCGYCTFAKAPARVESPYLSLDEVLDHRPGRRGPPAATRPCSPWARRPEERYPAAREWLDDHGYASTVDYLVAACRGRASRRPDCSPTPTPGPSSLADLARLRAVSASQGMMLESLNPDLDAHRRRPDKTPARRLATLEAAGRAGHPLHHRAAGRHRRVAGRPGRPRSRPSPTSHRRHGHVQEVIVQNFLPKPGTSMHQPPAVPDRRAAVDHRRRPAGPPRRGPRPGPPQPLRRPAPRCSTRASTTGAGCRRSPPTTSTPSGPGRRWASSAGPPRRPGSPWRPGSPSIPSSPSTPSAGSTRPCASRCSTHSDAEGLGRDHPWASGGECRPRPPRPGPVRRDGAVPVPDPPHARGATLASSGSAVAEVLAGVLGGHEVGEDEIVTLFSRPRPRGAGRGRGGRPAPAPRPSATSVTCVANRNINYTNVCTFKCRFCAFSKGPLSLNLRGTPYLLELSEITDRVREAEAAGATEVCLQGGIHPKFDGDYYLEVIRAVREASATIHIHGFTALEVTEGARRSGSRWPTTWSCCETPGSGTLPGTAAEILDDEVRAVLCPDKINTEEWLEAHRTAHSVGPALQRHHHVRSRRAAPVLGPAPGPDPGPASARRAGSPSSSPSPSSTWPRPSTSRSRPVGARPSARRC